MSSKEPAVVRTAKSPFEADVLVSILEQAGIPALRSGGMLTDEFAMTQQLMNVGGVEVRVPGDRLEEAMQVLKEADEAGLALDDSFDPGPPIDEASGSASSEDGAS